MEDIIKLFKQYLLLLHVWGLACRSAVTKDEDSSWKYLSASYKSGPTKICSIWYTSEGHVNSINIMLLSMKNGSNISLFFFNWSNISLSNISFFLFYLFLSLKTFFSLPRNPVAYLFFSRLCQFSSQKNNLSSFLPKKFHQNNWIRRWSLLFRSSVVKLTFIMYFLIFAGSDKILLFIL